MQSSTSSRANSFIAVHKHWFRQAFNRQENACLIALGACWTFLPVALYLTVFGAVFGAVVGGIGGEQSSVAQTLHLTSLSGLGGAIAGFFVGGFYGFLLIYRAALNNPISIVADMVLGFAIAVITLLALVRAEEGILLTRGYRKPTRRERELLDPMMADILDRMGIAAATPPDLYISGSQRPEAWTGAGSITIAEGLLDYDESEAPPQPRMSHPQALPAILAHEITHWRNSDGLATRFVWCCCWPIVAIMNLCRALSPMARNMQTAQGAGGHSSQQQASSSIFFGIGLIAFVIFWPFFICVKYIIGSAMSSSMRQAEYQADAGTAALGDDFRLGLRHALGELKDWERPRTGWEDVILATHPAIEQRLERLEQDTAAAIESAAPADAIATRPRKPASERPAPRSQVQPAKPD